MRLLQLLTWRLLFSTWLIALLVMTTFQFMIGSPSEAWNWIISTAAYRTLWVCIILAFVMFMTGHLARHRVLSDQAVRRYTTCPRCGYDCSTIPDFSACPECGLTADADRFREIWTNPKAR
jgi:hypothetical protein